MPHEVSGITTCNLQKADGSGKPCGAKFAGPEYIDLGQNGGRMGQLFEKLLRHMMDEHPYHMQQILLKGEEYKGLLYMMAFTTTDKEFQEQRNYFRWAVHQQTLNASITDEKLGLRVTEVAEAAAAEILSHGPVPWDIANTVSRHFEKMLREMRDALQEPVAPPNPMAPKAATQ